MEFPAKDVYVGRSLAKYGEHSKGEIELFKQFLREGDTVVEVGANVGAHTVPMCKFVGEKGRVIAIEAQRVLYGLMFKNLVANGCHNSTPVHAAGGAMSGVLSVPVVDYAAEVNFGGLSLERGGPGEAVSVMPIDALDLQELRLLKIDVEGMEMDVIAGARETIGRCRPVIYVENDREDNSSQLIQMIAGLGYRLWWHVTPLYEVDNFRGDLENVFPGLVSINMLALPREAEAEMTGFPPVRGPGDNWRVAMMNRAPAPSEKKKAAVMRLGALGDALWASSIVAHLHEKGYEVSVYTGNAGMEVLKHDPHIDELIHVPDGKIPLGELHGYAQLEALKYDRFIQLLESVENNLLADPRSHRYFWPKEVRHATMNGNYLEFIHDLAGLPHDFRQRFYPTLAELAWAADWRREIKQLVVLATAGSATHKWWPYWEQLAHEMLREFPQMHIVALGDEHGESWPNSPRMHTPKLDIRKAMTLAGRADMVIGVETGITNSVAFETMPKVVLLSHSTEENLTKHWENTVALSGQVPCYPCHRMHVGWTHCHQDQRNKAAMCKSAIPMGEVLHQVRKEFLVTEE